MKRKSSDRAIILIRAALSVVLLVFSFILILSPEHSAQNGWAFGLIGLVAGYWLGGELT